MKLRIVVDSRRDAPAPGELSLLVAEGQRDGSTLFARSMIEFARVIDLNEEGKPVYGEWQEVPMLFVSQKLELEKAEKLAREKARGTILLPNNATN